MAERDRNPKDLGFAMNRAGNYFSKQQVDVQGSLPLQQAVRLGESSTCAFWSGVGSRADFAGDKSDAGGGSALLGVLMRVWACPC